MAVVVRVDWPECTVENYLEGRELIPLAPGAPSGLIAHVAFADAVGLEVWDVWESPEEFRAYAEGTLRPGLEPLGIPGEPRIAVDPALAVFDPAVPAPDRAVVMRMAWPEATAEQYRQARELVGWERDVPPGAVFHVAFMGGNGFEAMDVWESPEQFEAFVESRLRPGIEPLGIEGEPAVTFDPVVGMFLPAAVGARA